MFINFENNYHCILLHLPILCVCLFSPIAYHNVLALFKQGFLSNHTFRMHFSTFDLILLRSTRNPF